MNNKKTEKRPDVMLFYFPLISFLTSIILIIVNWIIYCLKHVVITKLLLITCLILTMCLIIIIYQIIHRTFLSYLKSLLLTHEVQHMLVIPQEINDFTGQVKTSNLTQIYNSYLRKSYAKYENNRLYIWIRIPDNITAAKLLEDRLKNLREAIDSNNPEYLFSNFERVGKYYLRIGTK